MVAVSFHEKLRFLIEESGITQKQLANNLCIAISTLGGYVQGTSEPDFDTLKRLAEYFDVSTDYLLNIQTKQVNTDAETELLRIFRSLKPEQQDVYIEQGKAFIRINSKSL